MSDNFDTLKELRGQTGAGIMACRDALEASDWDIDAAAIILRARRLPNMPESEKITIVYRGETRAAYDPRYGHYAGRIDNDLS